MKWKATADLLVIDDDEIFKNIDGKISWNIEADSIEEAVNIACTKARKFDMVDVGTLRVILVEEDKKVITEKLFELLRYTRANQDIAGLDYNEQNQEVIIIYKDGRVKYVNVNYEMGSDMIREVLRSID